MLQAFIDASGTGSTQWEPFIVLAGFISTAEVWAQFSDAWQAELDRNPILPYFKMNEAFHPNAYNLKNKNPFDGWKEEDIQKKVFKFLNIIKEFSLGRIHVWLDKREFDRLVIKAVPKSERDNPYVLCFQVLILKVISSQVKYKIHFPVDFIFDEEGTIGKESLNWYKELKENHVPPQYHLFFGSPPIFRDDKLFLPLQAADVYAWLIRRHLIDNKNNNHTPTRPEFKLLQSMNGLIEHEINLKELSLYIQQAELPKC